MEKLMKATEVASILGISRSAVFELWKRGMLPHVRIGKSIRCVPSDLSAYIEANRSGEKKNLPTNAMASKFYTVTPMEIGDRHE